MAHLLADRAARGRRASAWWTWTSSPGWPNTATAACSSTAACWCPRSDGILRERPRRGISAGGRMARADRGAARSHRRRAARPPRPRPPTRCRWPRCSRAAPGRPVARWPARSAPTAAHPSRWRATARYSEGATMPGRSARHRPPAGAAQAHPPAPEGPQHPLVSHPGGRDQHAARLRGDARPAARRDRGRDAAGPDPGR